MIEFTKEQIEILGDLIDREADLQIDTKRDQIRDNELDEARETEEYIKELREIRDKVNCATEMKQATTQSGDS